MLVIGVKISDSTVVYRVIAGIDQDDPPRKIHDALKKATGGIDFSTVLCVEDDEVVLAAENEVDYDLTDSVEDEIDDEDLDSDIDLEDDLHEDAEDDE